MQKKFITPENRILITILSSIVFILLLVGIVRVSMNDLVEEIELKSFDWREQMATSRVLPREDIVLLVIDDISLQNAVSNPVLNLTRWPWPRRVQADLVKYLRNAGAKAIVFDIIFEGVEGNSEGNIESDQAFVEEVKKTENVFFALTLSYSKPSIEKYKQQNKIYKQNIMNISSPQLKKDVKKYAIYPQIQFFDQVIKDNIEFFNISNLLEGLLNNARSIGFVNLPESSDGVFRATRPISIFNGNFYPSLPLAVFLGLNPDSTVILKEDQLILNEKVIPLQKDGSHYVNWYGKPPVFKYFRALDVMLAQKTIDSGRNDPFDGSVFKDKIVIIGLTAAATDIISTPMSSAYPGPEYIATTINNYLESECFIAKMSSNLTLLIVIIFCLIAAILVLINKSGFKGICFSILVLILYIYLCVHLYINNFIWLEMVFPSLCILFTIMVTFVSKYIITRKAFEDTYKLATTDGLTKLFNHRYFQETLSVTLQRAVRYKTNISLLIVDIDNFKSINDTYGHRAGDQVLKDISARIKTCFRTTDIVARYGGEEIVVLLDNTGHDNSLVAAEKLLTAINSEPIVLRTDLSINVTVSIGVSTFPDHASTPSELIEIADQGLYYAKEHGKNRIGTIEDKLSSRDINKINNNLDDTLEINLKLDSKTYDDILKSSGSNNINDLSLWIINKIKENNK